jgi:hypothetical protein
MSEEKKIFIDEDWKSQVAAEKAAAEREPAPTPSGEAEEAGPPPAGQYPPASFEMLVTMFASEAMAGLGQFPHPLTGKQQVDLEQARYAIDMLEMLAEKTKGNLVPAEETGLRELLHQLRMSFIAVKTSAPAASPSAPPAAE